jgi:16S rRNA (guanine(966)-N(2))-methyltransferase RsmD
MRIIGGDAKGRRIYSPKNSKTRPTSDGIKESLFNILQEVSGKSFLDLFAGCGNVGLEALSRGAAKVVFVEKNPVMVNAIKRNLLELGINNKYQILETEAAKGIKKLQRKGEKFDFLFADPPYEKGFIREIFQYLGEGEMISSDGVAIFQHSVREDIPGTLTGTFILTDQRRYGDTRISFFKRMEREKGTYI